jgi:hypothetical protein
MLRNFHPKPYCLRSVPIKSAAGLVKREAVRTHVQVRLSNERARARTVDARADASAVPAVDLARGWPS